MISGCFNLEGAERPRNALFIFAENVPGFIKETSALIAAHLAGAGKLELGKVYGDFANGTAVEAIQVPGVDHVRIIWSADAAGGILRWVDSVVGGSIAGELDFLGPLARLLLLC